MEQTRITISKIELYENGYHFNDEMNQVESYGRICTERFGYIFKPLELLIRGEESSQEECFLIYCINEKIEIYPKDLRYSGNNRTIKQSVKYAILGNKEDAQTHCKVLAEKSRENIIKKEQKYREASIKDVHEGRRGCPLELIIE